MIAELIAKTKQQRFDKKLTRDELEGATDRLDEKWKELIQKGALASIIMPPKAKAEKKEPTSAPSKDSYDILV